MKKEYKELSQIELNKIYASVESSGSIETVCSSCGKKDSNDDPIFLSVDPFAHEMYDNDEEVLLCHDCYESKLGDI